MPARGRIPMVRVIILASDNFSLIMQIGVGKSISTAILVQKFEATKKQIVNINININIKLSGA